MVLAILGIFAGIAAPRFSAATNRSAVDQAADRIVGLHERAVRSAGAQSGSARIACDPGTDSLTLSTAGSGDVRLDLGAEPYRVDIVAVDYGGAASVTINAWGDADVASLYRLRRGGVERIVQIGLRAAENRILTEDDAAWEPLANQLPK